MLQPLVSVIVATYNAEETLANCLQSVVNQTYSNIEVCIVDGISADGTLGVIESFATRYPCINYITEKDKGIYDALNKGITMAAGEWLYFLGSDDELTSPQILTDIFSETDQDTDLIYGNMVGLHTGKKHVSNTETQVISKGISHQSTFYKKRLFNELGKYNLQFKIAADYEFILKVFLNPRYKKTYVDKDIAYFGERGLSSGSYDYAFFSCYYKILAQHSGLTKVTDAGLSLQKSIDGCFYLAKNKQQLALAWQNILFYLFHKNPLPLTFKIRTFFRMIYWTLYNNK